MAEYKVRESYRNAGWKCFKVSFLDFLENLGEGFEDKGYETGKNMVLWGFYFGGGIKLRILHSGKILYDVYVKYTGYNPDGDLKELRNYFEVMGLKRKTLKVERLEGKTNASKTISQ